MLSLHPWQMLEELGKLDGVRLKGALFEVKYDYDDSSVVHLYRKITLSHTSSYVFFSLCKPILLFNKNCFAFAYNVKKMDTIIINISIITPLSHIYVSYHFLCSYPSLGTS